MNASTEILTPAELQQRAPAIYAEHAAPSRKPTYGFVSTSDILSTLALDGWQPTYVGLKRSQSEARRMYGSHTLRLRHADATFDHVLQGVPEIVLRNGHDGSSAVKLDVGVFRFVCANGLVCASALFGGFRLCHSQYAADKVREGIAGLSQQLPRLHDAIDAMRSKQLDVPAQLRFAEQAATLRWGAVSPVHPAALLERKRLDDITSDVWTIYNVIQEHLLRGGDAGRATTGRRLTTRAIRNVDASYRINRDLWALAENMASAGGM